MAGEAHPSGIQCSEAMAATDRTIRHDRQDPSCKRGDSLGLSGLASAQDVDPETSIIWKKVRADLFAGMAIGTGDGVVVLDAPKRAEDATVVPIAIRAQFPQTKDRYIEKLWLIVDNNPSPIAAVFQFTPESGRADIETRIRIEQYSHIRAIALTNDGKLQMATNYIKASGGCSAPGSNDALATKATIGKMRLRVDDAVAGGRPALAQLMISHPNDSGLAMDQLTRAYTTPTISCAISRSATEASSCSAPMWTFRSARTPTFVYFFHTDGVVVHSTSRSSIIRTSNFRRT